MKKETIESGNYVRPALKSVAIGARAVLCEQSGLEDYEKGDDIDFGD